MTDHEEREYTVGDVSRLYPVTVRTLHHWDLLGLLVPSGRDWNSYRLYSVEDLERLNHILAYRSTGMQLATIGTVLDDPSTSVIEHLQRQKELLIQKSEQLSQMLKAVNTLIGDAMTDEQKLSAEQKAELFGDAWKPEYEQEAAQRWSDSEDWQESQRRQLRMTKEDWSAVKIQLEQLNERLSEAMRQGVQPGTAEANELAEEHRSQLGHWFDVSHAKQVLIARNYTEDPRFASYYDSYAAGLSGWLRSIIERNAERHGVDPAQAEWR